jgi:hypothetical protein
MTEVSVRGRGQRTRHIIIPELVVLLAIGAAAVWGPVGLGSGPLEVVMNVAAGGADAGQTPVGFILPMNNSGGSGAVVDSVDLVDGTRYYATTDSVQLVECGRGAHLDPAVHAAAANG